MRDESYSFIWQPKVLMNTFLGAVNANATELFGEADVSASLVSTEVKFFAESEFLSELFSGL